MSCIIVGNFISRMASQFRLPILFMAITAMTACNSASTSENNNQVADTSVVEEKTPVVPKYDTYAESIMAMRAKKNESILGNGIIEPDKVSSFKGLSYFEPDTNFIFKANLEIITPEKVVFKTTDERAPVYYKYCKLTFNTQGKEAVLFGYVNEDEIKTPKSIFVPFKDATSNVESYGGGRYVDLEYHGEKNMMVLDFNYAYNPYCHYSHNFSCPLVPSDNVLKVSINAGEKKLYD